MSENNKCSQCQKDLDPNDPREMRLGKCLDCLRSQQPEENGSHTPNMENSDPGLESGFTCGFCSGRKPPHQKVNGKLTLNHDCKIERQGFWGLPCKEEFSMTQEYLDWMTKHKLVKPQCPKCQGSELKHDFNYHTLSDSQESKQKVAELKKIGNNIQFYTKNTLLLNWLFTN